MKKLRCKGKAISKTNQVYIAKHVFKHTKSIKTLKKDTLSPRALPWVIVCWQRPGYTVNAHRAY